MFWLILALLKILNINFTDDYNQRHLQFLLSTYVHYDNKRPPMKGLDYSDNLEIQFEGKTESFCISFLNWKDRARFNDWYFKTQRGY